MMGVLGSLLDIVIVGPHCVGDAASGRIQYSMISHGLGVPECPQSRCREHDYFARVSAPIGVVSSV